MMSDDTKEGQTDDRNEEIHRANSNGIDKNSNNIQMTKDTTTNSEQETKETTKTALETTALVPKIENGTSQPWSDITSASLYQAKPLPESKIIVPAKEATGHLSDTDKQQQPSDTEDKASSSQPSKIPQSTKEEIITPSRPTSSFTNTKPAIVSNSLAEKLINGTVVKPNITEVSDNKTNAKTNTVEGKAVSTPIPPTQFANSKPTEVSLKPTDKLTDGMVSKPNNTEVSADKTIVKTDTIGKETASTPIVKTDTMGNETASTPMPISPFENSKPTMVANNPEDKVTNDAVPVEKSNNTDASADETIVKTDTMGKVTASTPIPTSPFSNTKPTMVVNKPANKLANDAVPVVKPSHTEEAGKIENTKTTNKSLPKSTSPFTKTEPKAVSKESSNAKVSGFTQATSTKVSPASSVAPKPLSSDSSFYRFSSVTKPQPQVSKTKKESAIDLSPISKNIRCQPCERMKVNLLASGYCEDCSDYLCGMCISYHRRFHTLQNHRILEGTMVLDQWRDEGCSSHKNDLITYYCRQHDMVGCSKCMILEHRQCEVKLISDMLLGFDFRNNDLPQLLQSTTNKITECTEDVLKTGKLTNKFYSEALQTITHRRECIDGILDEQQKHAFEDIEAKLITDTAILDNLNEKLNAFGVETNRIETDFRYTAGSKTNLSFIKRKQAIRKLKQVEMSIKDVQASFNERQPSKLQCPELPPFLFQQLAFDRVVYQGNEQSEINLVTAEINECPNVNIPIFGKSYNRWITGMASYSKDEVVVVDNLNYMLVIMSIESDEMSYYQHLPARPWDVTSIDKILAITFPFKQSIKLYDKDTLTEIRSIPVKGECHGIDHHEGKLAVSYVDTEKVEVLKTDGTLLHCFDVDSAGAGLFTRPLYTCFSREGDHVYVTENDDSSVIKISMNHPVVTIYKDSDLASPTAITTTSTGHLLVASKRHGTLNLLSDNFTSFQTILQPTFTARYKPTIYNIQPQSLLYNEQTGHIIVSLGVDQFLMDNSLKVYEAKSAGKTSVTTTAKTKSISRRSITMTKSTGQTATSTKSRNTTSAFCTKSTLKSPETNTKSTAETPVTDTKSTAETPVTNTKCGGTKKTERFTKIETKIRK